MVSPLLQMQTVTLNNGFSALEEQPMMEPNEGLLVRAAPSSPCLYYHQYPVGPGSPGTGQGLSVCRQL